MSRRATPVVQFCRAPATQFAFVNVSIVPVQARDGTARFMSAAWGGALHVFDPQGRASAIPLPDGTLGTYAFVADREPGFAWAVLTSVSKITVARVDVDDGSLVFVQDVPLRGMVWSAVMTSEGLLVCSAHPGDVMVYDTGRREVRTVLAPISPGNHYPKYLQLAPDGHVIVPAMVPGAELVRLDPRTGATGRMPAGDYVSANRFLPASVTLLPSGCYAIPGTHDVTLLEYPGFGPVAAVKYPDDGEWETFRNEADGRLFACRGADEPLYALDAGERWVVYLPRFPRQSGRVRLHRGVFAALPHNRLLGLSTFGELVQYDAEGVPRQVTELDNVGHQQVCALAAGEQGRVFTTTFINSSFQELDLATGKGRNIRPCQKSGGQATHAVWFRHRLWLACYGGAEITVYDPQSGGDWPQNPRPFVEIAEGQMRPVGLCAGGESLWCATHARYGKYGGALARIDPDSGTVRVWPNPWPDHNPTSIVPDPARGRICGGTTVWPDMRSAPAAKGPAGVFAFDTVQEDFVWRVQPLDGAEDIRVLAVWKDLLVAAAGGRLLLMRADDGTLVRTIDAAFPRTEPPASLFVGGDDGLYLASPDGLFCYDPEAGPGKRLIEGPVALPHVREMDLFFVRGYDVGWAANLWK